MRVKWFKEIEKDDLPSVGGKGANLGVMFGLKLPVPNGFCVTAQTYKEFIDKTKLWNKIKQVLDGIDIEDTKGLQAGSDKIQTLIRKAKIPQDIVEEIKTCYEVLGSGNGAQDMVQSPEVYVAVRSSATAEDLPEASFAGQQATFLNVHGADAVVTAVQGCWASLFTARAIYYRQKNNFPHDKVLISAVVQRMVNSSKSGVMFSINPATNDGSEIVIEAIYGLGEYIVGGKVSPDLYVVDKASREIKDVQVKRKEIGLFRVEGGNKELKIKEEMREKRVLNDKQLQELARLAKRLEEHYGKPQDIEWAVEHDHMYLVQTRPVTTYSEKKEKDEAVSEGKVLLRGETASKGVASGPVTVVHELSELDKVKQGDVLVTVMTTPDMVPAMQKASAIVTDDGGMTCHAAIVSREMGTPCIVGTEHASEILKSGQVVTVDATHGVVYEGDVSVKQEAQAKSKDAGPLASGEAIVTATEVKVIADLPDLAAKAAQTRSDGVGLARLEFIIATGKMHPGEYIRQNKDTEYTELLKDGLRVLAKAFSPRPVWVRSSDLRSDEYRNLEGGDKEPKETDPMIGWHGIRRLVDEPRLMKAEFQAIRDLHYEGLKNIGIMLPFIISVDELRVAKEMMASLGLEPVTAIDFGVMIETPASCWIVEDLCKEGISFASFGTNDLTQLTLGIDRNNAKIQKLFDEMHPAVLGEMAKVIKTCRKYKVKTSICGQAGSRPEMAEFLVHQGIDSITANIDAVDEIRHVVARTERKLLLDTQRGE